MVHITRWLIVAATAVAATLFSIQAAGAQELTAAPAPAEDVGQYSSDEVAPGITLDGSIIIDERVWLTLIGEPGRHMNDAFESFAGGDRSSSAESIRKAASFLYIAGENALDLPLNGPKTKGSLVRAADALSELSRRIAADEAATVDELKSAFSRAHLAMSRHHASKAAEATINRRWRMAGHYLSSSADHLQRASHWAGRELRPDTRAQIQDARRQAGPLIDGDGKSSGAIGKLIETLRERIERFGNGLGGENSPPRDQPDS